MITGGFNPDNQSIQMLPGNVDEIQKTLKINEIIRQLNDLMASENGESTGGGTVDTYSRINSGTVDGVVQEVLPLYYNESQQAFKILVGGFWITLATVSFDSLWDSLTDTWDSVQMDWDAPS